MRTLRLTKQLARHLIPAIESDKKGIPTGTLRRYNNMMDKLWAPVAEYVEAIDRIALQFRGCDNDDHILTHPECIRCVENTIQRDVALESLTDLEGECLIEIVLEDAEFDLLLEKWQPMLSSGQRAAVKINLQLDAAIDSARTGNITMSAVDTL